MATEREILNVLDLLASVYDVDPEPRGFFIALGDVEAAALQAGAEQFIRANRWMPRPSELRQACLKEQHFGRRSDPLAAEVAEMHYDFHHGRPEAFDPARLEQIALEYERLGRVHAAEHVRERSRCMARALENVETAEQRQARYRLPPEVIAARRGDS